MQNRLNLFLIGLSMLLVICLIAGFVAVIAQHERNEGPSEPAVITYVKVEYELYEERELDIAKASCALDYWKALIQPVSQAEYMQACMLLRGYEAQPQ